MKVALLNTKPTARAAYLFESLAAGNREARDSPYRVTADDPLTTLEAADVAVQIS